MNKKQVAITLGIMCFILTSAIIVQLNTIQDATKTVGQTLNDNELKDEVLKWKERYDNAYQDLERAEKRLEQKREQASANSTSSAQAEDELKLTNALLGLTEVKGPGIVLTLKDNEGITQETAGYNMSYYLIHDGNLRFIINEIKNAGAEAISINDQRIVPTTSISCGGNIIDINGEKVGTPFEIKAIGLPEQLAALSRQGGYLELLKDASVGVELKKSNNITIPKYTGVITYKYAENTK